MAQSIIELSRSEGIIQGIEQGIEQERRESTIRHILVVLKTKFSSDIVDVLTPAIQNISDAERLEALLPAAVEAEDLEAFVRADASRIGRVEKQNGQSRLFQVMN